MNYITVNTHVHADHVTGTGKLKAALPHFKSMISTKAEAIADIYLNDREVVTFGTQVIN